jgi:hypothetical protein
VPGCHRLKAQNIARWGAVLGVVLAGLWLRWPGLSHGYTSDEISFVLPQSFWDILWQGESAVNPPWFRATLNALFAPHEVVLWGRRWSMAMAGVTLALIAFLGRSYGKGSLWAGLAAATLFAFDPWAIDHAALFRVYSTTTAVAVWHLLALGAITSGQGEKHWRWQLGISAFLLPQLHYIWLPVLGVLGLALLLMRRKCAWLYVPAALGMVPWLAFMWVYPGEHHPMSTAETWAIVEMISKLGSQYGRTWVGPLAAVAVLGFVWLNTSSRLACLGAAAVFGVIAIVAQVHLVRVPVSLFLLVFLCAMLAGLIGALPSRGLQPLLATAILLGIVNTHRTTVFYDLPTSTPHNNLLHFHPFLPKLIARYDVGAVVVQPDYYLPVLHLYQTSLPLSRATNACDDLAYCYGWKGVKYTGQFGALFETQTTLVVSVRWEPLTLPDRCSQLRAQDAFALWVCPPTRVITDPAPRPPR